jgi:hypothetical protein
MNFFLVATLSVMAIAMPPPLSNEQATVAELKKRVAELEAQVGALEKARITKPLAGWNELTAGMTKGEVTAALGKFQDDVRFDCFVGKAKYQCSRWVLPDGGIVEFQRHSEIIGREIVRRWRLPGCGGWLS